MYIICGKDKNFNNVRIAEVQSKKEAQEKKKELKNSNKYYNIYILKEKG